MLRQLELPNQSLDLLSVLQVQQFVHLVRWSLYRGLVGDPLQTHLRPLELQLQAGLVRVARWVEDHGLEVEPDAVREVEAGRGGQEDQVHQRLRLFAVPTQVERTQLRDVELEVAPLSAREVRVHTHSLQVLDRGQVVRVESDQQRQGIFRDTWPWPCP